MTTRITEITVGRLYNTGSYENMRYEVQIIVEDGDVDGAFTMARSTIEAQHAAFLAEKERKEEEAAERQRQEWEARRERQLQEAEARREQLRQQRQATHTRADNEPEF